MRSIADYVALTRREIMIFCLFERGGILMRLDLGVNVHMFGFFVTDWQSCVDF